MPTIEDSLSVLTTPKEDKRVSVKDIIIKLFEKEHINQKSILTDTNINAILKMRAANTYLMEEYGFRISTFDGLIDDKLVYIISRKARGRDDIVRVIEAMRDIAPPEEPKRGLF